MQISYSLLYSVDAESTITIFTLPSIKILYSLYNICHFLLVHLALKRVFVGLQNNHICIPGNTWQVLILHCLNNRCLNHLDHLHYSGHSNIWSFIERWLQRSDCPKRSVGYCQHYLLFCHLSLQQR